MCLLLSCLENTNFLPWTRICSTLGVCLLLAVPIIKLFAWGEGDSGGHVLRETTLLTTVVPNTLLCAWGEEDSAGHVP